MLLRVKGATIAPVATRRVLIGLLRILSACLSRTSWQTPLYVFAALPYFPSFSSLSSVHYSNFISSLNQSYFMQTAPTLHPDALFQSFFRLSFLHRAGCTSQRILATLEWCLFFFHLRLHEQLHVKRQPNISSSFAFVYKFGSEDGAKRHLCILFHTLFPQRYYSWFTFI